MTKIRFIHLSIVVANMLSWFSDRHMDEERRSRSDRAFNRYEPSMFLDDLMRHREPQTATFILAGKKRIENMLQIVCGNANAGILDFDLDEFGGALCAVLAHGAAHQGDCPGPFHRLDRVQD